MVGCLSGCATVAPQSPSTVPEFSGITDSCAQAAAPAMDAIRDYTGELFNETVEFEDESGSYFNSDAPVKICKATYVDTGASQSAGSPLKRVITLSISLELGDDPVGASRSHFLRAYEDMNGGATTALGDESFESWDAIDDTALVAFRDSNVYVSTAVAGWNWSEQKGIGGPPAADSEVQPGAQKIAAALAENLGSVLTLS